MRCLSNNRNINECSKTVTFQSPETALNWIYACMHSIARTHYHVTLVIERALVQKHIHQHVNTYGSYGQGGRPMTIKERFKNNLERLQAFNLLTCRFRFRITSPEI